MTIAVRPAESRSAPCQPPITPDSGLLSTDWLAGPHDGTQTPVVVGFTDFPRRLRTGLPADLPYWNEAERERYDGVAAIREVYDLLARRPDFMIKQFITAHTVDVGDGHGTGQCHLLATQARRGTSYLVAGSYVDEYVTVDGRWVFQRMTLHVYFSVPSGVGWAGRDLHYLNPVVAELMSSLDQR
jgi:hypothetical protein